MCILMKLVIMKNSKKSKRMMCQKINQFAFCP